ncbi:hypothetical protein L873DRAFT_474784 [Choiromyces venosus 120613-1]|uniref:Uncharacterized protein n=1 Tax=Choiromyces venosus 120613-1 TaxID=1336337 RepID=A0A3N4IYX6_9PEZI|nr:hypothetical protein L873DRAFT_474784 [Choiromyces venosus 120613-1]
MSLTARAAAEDELPPAIFITSTTVIMLTPHSSSGHNLLQGPVASLVSLISRSTTASIRPGSIIGGTVLDSARLGTLTGLEIGGAAAEGILPRAGRDVRDDGWDDRSVSVYLVLSMANQGSLNR